MDRVSRRTFLRGASLLPLAAALPRGWIADAVAAEAPTWRFFDAHQAAVVDAATARLIPGPADDPAEVGHPGAREAGVTVYIDRLLSALDDAPGDVFAGGPWSDRHGGEVNHFLDRVSLSEAQRAAWRIRLDDLRQQYVAGIEALDGRAGGDFTALPGIAQDEILAAEAPGGFRDLLFTHALEGFLSAPEYGGNRDLAGWNDIRFPGDSQPDGWTDEEVSRSDGLDPVDPVGVVGDVLAVLASDENAQRAIVRGLVHG